MNDLLKLKRIPYGKTDFNDFKEKNLYYVDKTRFIRDIHRNPTKEKNSYLVLKFNFSEELMNVTSTESTEGSEGPMEQIWLSLFFA